MPLQFIFLCYESVCVLCMHAGHEYAKENLEFSCHLDEENTCAKVSVMGLLISIIMLSSSSSPSSSSS